MICECKDDNHFHPAGECPNRLDIYYLGGLGALCESCQEEIVEEFKRHLYERPRWTLCEPM